ncbi:hypothetical protein HYDPIDRAFT_30936 [Hydnomerulius pinastri MD-312]|uniref:F-box domain-containing protein n=1 Tax=Hydnomerulius pinastri MD-312 TaxID=994086 RepID=A0A0C9W5B9_9AGAM|nr:hypothetical protein HYDPIDRAFT_30936 [Hydnomerulius pinastri MD-312]
MEALNEVQVCLDEYLRVASTSLSASTPPKDLETPFSQYNSVNFVPGPKDIAFIDGVVSDRNSQLLGLACEISRVESTIWKLANIRAQLEESRSHVRQSMLTHQALTSPARRLPPEVLGEIFYRCLPRTPYITPRDVECPMVLTKVCHYWRAVAMSTPRLWSSVTIHLQRVTKVEFRPGYDAWLAKAKSVPLAVRVLNDIDASDADSICISSVVEWLRPLITRCGDFWWHGPSLQGLFANVTDPRLERLRITSLRGSPSVFMPGPATYLRSAYLQCLNHDLQSLGTMTLPWEQLTELNMHFALFSSSVFLHLLRLCTGLRNVTASCLCADEEQLEELRGTTPGSIINYSLRRIEIKVIRAGLDLLFDALVLPALEELEICFCYRERDAWPHVQFMSLLARSRCPLKKLVIRSNKNALSYFAEYKQALPSLSIYTAAPPS